MIQVLLLFLIPAFGLSSDDVLGQQPRWDFANVTPGDHYTYLICDNGAINKCYDARLLFQSDGTIHVTITDRLAQYVVMDGTMTHIGDRVTGTYEEDTFEIDFLSLDVPPRHYLYAPNWQYVLDVTSWDPDSHQHARGLEDTIFLIGGKIRVGDGPDLEHSPVLEIGEVWSMKDRPHVIVTGHGAGYSYGSLSIDSKVYTVEYSPREPLLEIQVTENVPLPLQGMVLTDTSKLVHESKIDSLFWYRLIDTSHPDFKIRDPETPKPEMPKPATSNDIISEVIQIPDMLADSLDAGEPANSSNADEPTNNSDDTPGTDIQDIFDGISPERLRELFTEFVKTISGGTASDVTQDVTADFAIRSDRNDYQKGDTITFSGNTPYPQPTGMIGITIDSQEITQIPVTFNNDGTFSVQTKTDTWGIPGTGYAEIIQGTHTTGTVFDFGVDTFQFDPDSINYTLEGRESDAEVFADRISIYTTPGSETELLMTVPHDIAPRDHTFDVYVDHTRTAFAKNGTDTDQTISVQIPSTASFIQIFFADAANPAQCSGSAQCIDTILSRVVDGDTVKIHGNTNIRFALASAPELEDPAGPQAAQHIESICPPGSTVLVDEDDLQTGGSYGRIIGVIHCNGVNLNEELLESGYGYIITRFCGTSEFAGESWAVRYGC